MGRIPYCCLEVKIGKEAFYIMRNCTKEEKERLSQGTISGVLVVPECYY